MLKRSRGLLHLILKVLKILKCQIWNFLIVTFEVFKVAEIRFFIVFIPFNFIYLRIHLSKPKNIKSTIFINKLHHLHEYKKF